MREFLSLSSDAILFHLLLASSPVFFCTMAHVFIYCAPHPFRERVFQTPTMRGMIRTGIIFIATQTLSNSALPHIQNKEILKKDAKKYSTKFVCLIWRLTMFSNLLTLVPGNSSCGSYWVIKGQTQLQLRRLMFAHTHSGGRRK